MSRRLNIYGFRMSQMKAMCGSRDEAAVTGLRGSVALQCGHFAEHRRAELIAITERAVLDGIPFRELETETSLHAAAANLLAGHRQDWLITGASVYNASALELGLWPQARKHGSPEVRAFLRGIVEGVPLFGRQSPVDGSAYAALPLDSLRAFLPHLRDLAELIDYRIGRKRSPTDDDRADAAFSAEFCGWVDEIVTAGRDLWFCYG